MIFGKQFLGVEIGLDNQSIIKFFRFSFKKVFKIFGV